MMAKFSHELLRVAERYVQRDGWLSMMADDKNRVLSLSIPVADAKQSRMRYDLASSER